MPRLSALEHSTSPNITTLAVPELGPKQHTSGFIHELEKHEAELEEAFEFAKTQKSFSLPEVAWAERILMGKMSMGDQLRYDLSEHEKFHIVRVFDAERLWSIACIKILFGKSLAISDEDRLWRFTTSYLPKHIGYLGNGTQFVDSDYILAVASAKVLFPSKFDELMIDMAVVSEHCTKQIAVHLERGNWWEAVAMARSFRILFPNEPDPIPAIYDRDILKVMIDELPAYGMPEALIALAARKFAMASHIFVTHNGVLAMYTGNEGVFNTTTDEPVPPLPPQRSF